jgi:two-component system, OmpR family, phosphate regulon sensor histidine kinase PhoR
MSIRSKLFLTYLLVILLALGTLGLYMSREIDRRYRATFEDNLVAQATLLRDIISADFSSAPQTGRLQREIQQLSGEIGLRVTLIDPTGTVLADSEHDPRTMENHATRPEVRQAFTQGQGRGIHTSRTLGVQMLYVAVPVKRANKIVGVVRLAQPLTQLDAAQKRLQAAIFWGALLALLLALLVSIKLTHDLSADIRALSRTAKHLAAGELEAKAIVHSGGEVGALASAFNEMAARLARLLAETTQEQRKVATILEKIGEAIIVADQNGHISFCNPMAQKLFGLKPEQPWSVSLLDVTQDVALAEAFRKAVTEQKATELEITQHFPQTRTLQVHITPLTDQAVSLGAVAILRDISELRRLEAVRREFVANASHELQTPIAAIKAMAETLLAGGREEPELMERFLADMERQADRLGAQVRDLLDLAAIEAGPAALTFCSLEVADIAARVVAHLQPLADQRNIVVENDVLSDLNVTADANALTRILSNLLDNALKYTEPGGRVALSATRQADEVAITVRDTGIGMLQSDLGRIFERFYRVDKARSTATGGTGLGLAIVKHLVEILGGRISVTSELGRGSEFTVILPFRAA